MRNLLAMLVRHKGERTKYLLKVNDGEGEREKIQKKAFLVFFLKGN